MSTARVPSDATARTAGAGAPGGAGGAPRRRLVRELAAHVGDAVELRGWVHQRRNLGGIQFLHLRDRSGMVQCVFEGIELPLHESCVRVAGTVTTNVKAPGGLEVAGDALDVISRATRPPPIELAKESFTANPDTLLEYRQVSVRGLRAQATLKVKSELVRAFRAFLDARDFTEIFTPKLVAAGAEGGANLFDVDYYGQRAYLAQSPQLYKQMMVPVFERVFETAPVYRAERHHTSRHLAEYLSLDVEFAFIEDDGDVMDLQEALVKSMVEAVAERCAGDVARLGARLPDTQVVFPRVSLLDARRLVAERYGHESGGKDLDPEAERLIAQWAKQEHGSDFVFVTRYPRAARPFYTYPTGDGLTRGLDLIFRGVEITSGGQRVHEHGTLLAEMRERGLDPTDFAGYLEVFEHGMPPHGGFAIGTERFTALLLSIPNLRFARAFPRDGSRLQP
jgi:nondiscriminating aspartyl-tRNA synthetase